MPFLLPRLEMHAQAKSGIVKHTLTNCAFVMSNTASTGLVVGSDTTPWKLSLDCHLI